MILPPPISRREEPIGPSNVNIPGEIVVGTEGQLLKRYLQFEGFTSDLIEGFNNWIDRIMPEQLAARPIILPGNRQLRITAVRLAPPTVTEGLQSSVQMTPYMARVRNLTYAANIYADMEMVDDQGAQLGTVNGVDLGKIPIMLGSSLDYLRGKSDLERLEMGECANDPLGYFIIRGMERVILLQEKLRVNRIFIFNNRKREPIARMTCANIRGTTIITLSRESNVLRLNLHFLGRDRTINPLQVFSLFGVDEVQTILTYIRYFVKPDHWVRVWFALRPTIVDYLGIGDSIEYISLLRGMKGPVEERRWEILTYLNDQLFPQMNHDYLKGNRTDPEVQRNNNEVNQRKLYLLAMMIAWYAEHLTGFRKMDDRDNWGKKRLDSAGKMMEQLFSGLWNKVATNVEDNFARRATLRFNAADVARQIRAGIITDDFITAFTTGIWGAKGSRPKDRGVVVDVLKRESMIAVYSHLTRINTPVSREDKTPRIRYVQMSQIGYVDSIETPEGKATGLIKNKAVTCYLSIDRDPTPIRKIIAERGMISTLNPTEVMTSPLLLNGQFIGWVPGEQLRRLLVELRRNGTIYRDVAVVLDSWNVLQVYTDGGRPLRPLLIIDPTNNQLVIEQENLWKEPMEVLLRAGAVEYIDAIEQEYLLIAQHIGDVNSRRLALSAAIEKRQQAESMLEELVSRVSGAPTREQLLQVLPSMIGRIPTATLTDEQMVREYQATVERFRRYVQQAQNTINNLSLVPTYTDYTNSELDPNATLGIASSIIPFPDRNQAPRNVFQCAMAKQALGLNHTNMQARFDPSVKSLAYPTRPIAETQLYSALGMNATPAGQTVTLAVMAYTGYNQEDSIIFKASSINYGLFRYVVHKTYRVVESRRGNIVDQITRPRARNEEEAERLRHLDENGIVRVGSMVRRYDVLVGKVRTNTQTRKATTSNERLQMGDDGIVERVLVTTNEDGDRVVIVKIRQVRVPVVGDKFASRSAQKGTIGMVLPDEDMPFTANGVRPDVIINPHCLPSRMTIGKIFEIVSSKGAVLRGERVNATAFQPFDLETFKRYLSNYGYSRHGTERMMSGYDGRMIEADIFVGPCYYQQLRHTVQDKYQMRSRGVVMMETRQPVQGRKKGGGLRIGRNLPKWAVTCLLVLGMEGNTSKFRETPYWFVLIIVVF